MKILCVSNHAAFLSDHQLPRGSTNNSTYPVSSGRSYEVFGMTLDENQLSFLVSDDWGWPCFVPAGLFDLGVFEIPQSWEFGLQSGIRASGYELWSDPSQAIWGYPELVRDPHHAAALVDREASAIDIFRNQAGSGGRV